MRDFFKWFLLIASCLFLQSAYSTTVLQIHIDDMLSKSQLVFEGEVIASEARWNEKKTNISTHITFKIDDLIKGDYANNLLQISFGGGTVGDMTLKISGMEYPKVGDRGIFFIEQIDKPQVNPLIGWSQGHFRIAKDQAGQDRILTENKKIVLGLEQTGATVSRSLRTNRMQPFAHGVAEGLRLGQDNEPLSNAMEKQSFTSSLKQRLKSLQRPTGIE